MLFTGTGITPDPQFGSPLGQAAAFWQLLLGGRGVGSGLPGAPTVAVIVLFWPGHSGPCLVNSRSSWGCPGRHYRNCSWYRCGGPRGCRNLTVWLGWTVAAVTTSAAGSFQFNIFNLMFKATNDWGWSIWRTTFSHIDRLIPRDFQILCMLPLTERAAWEEESSWWWPPECGIASQANYNQIPPWIFYDGAGTFLLFQKVFGHHQK